MLNVSEKDSYVARLKESIKPLMLQNKQTQPDSISRRTFLKWQLVYCLKERQSQKCTKSDDKTCTQLNWAGA